MKPKIAAGVIALALAGCSSPLVAEAPEPPITKGVEYLKLGKYYTEMAMVCDGHGHRVFQVTGSSDRPKIIDDPTCPGGKEQQ